MDVNKTIEVEADQKIYRLIQGLNIIDKAQAKVEEIQNRIKEEFRSSKCLRPS